MSVGAVVLGEYLRWVIGQEEVERPEHRETIRGTEAESNVAAVVERLGERVLQLGGPGFASWAYLRLTMDKAILKCYPLRMNRSPMRSCVENSVPNL